MPASSGPDLVEVLVQASTSSVLGPIKALLPASSVAGPEEALVPANSVPSPVEAQELTKSEPGPVEALVVPNVQSDLPRNNAQQDKYEENTHKSLLVSAGKPSVKVLSNLTNKRGNEDYVSPVMQSMLQVPEPPKKETYNTLREKLPKGLPGKTALDMMRKRQKKKEEQKAKEERKREQKRKEKKEEKNRKKIQRMEKQEKNSAKKKNGRG